MAVSNFSVAQIYPANGIAKAKAVLAREGEDWVAGGTLLQILDPPPTMKVGDVIAVDEIGLTS